MRLMGLAVSGAVGEPCALLLDALMATWKVIPSCTDMSVKAE